MGESLYTGIFDARDEHHTTPRRLYEGGGRERGREGGRIGRQGGEEREDSSGRNVSH